MIALLNYVDYFAKATKLYYIKNLGNLEFLSNYYICFENNISFPIIYNYVDYTILSVCYLRIIVVLINNKPIK